MTATASEVLQSVIAGVGRLLELERTEPTAFTASLADLNKLDTEVWSLVDYIAEEEEK